MSSIEAADLIRFIFFSGGCKVYLSNLKRNASFDKEVIPSGLNAYDTYSSFLFFEVYSCQCGVATA
jgi:hypothetical protein